MNLKALQLRLAELKNKQKSDVAKLETVDAAAQDALLTEMEADQAEMEKVTKSIATVTAAMANNEEGDSTKAAGASNGAPALGIEGGQSLKSLASAGRWSELKNVTGDRAEIVAFSAGLWFAAKFMKNEKASETLKSLSAKFTDQEIQDAAMVEGVDTDGGFLVPKEISIQIERRAARQSVFYRDAKVEPMRGDKKSVITNDGRLKFFYTGELQPGPISKMGFSVTEMSTEKLLGFVAISSELNEDAYTDLGDLVIGEFAAALQDIIDATGFFGDGTAKFGNFKGIIKSVLDLNGTPANIGSVFVKDVAANKGWADITRADLQDVIANIEPKYARNGDSDLTIYTSLEFYNKVISRIINEGQYSVNDVQDGTVRTGRRFEGLRVEILPTFELVLDDDNVTTVGFPKAYANGQVPFIVANLAKTSIYGNRTGLTIDKSLEALYTLDGVMYRARKRHSIKHVPASLGVASATEGLRKKGGVSLLYVKNAA